MESISAVILAKNEERNIARCIKALLFCSEILVIDDYSTDKTSQIARKHGARVIKHALNNNFARQRNFALQNAKENWVLFVDADELVSRKLKNEIKKIVKNSKYDGYFIRRADTWLGKTLKGGEFGLVCLLRLGRANKGKWIRAVHEHWAIDGEVSILKGQLQHYPHISISDFISHINFHSNLHASENIKEGKTATIFVAIFYPIGKFIKNFILRGGYKDGTHGFVAAMIMSFHSFLAWSSIWIKNNKK